MQPQLLQPLDSEWPRKANFPVEPFDERRKERKEFSRIIPSEEIANESNEDSPLMPTERRIDANQAPLSSGNSLLDVQEQRHPRNEF